MIRAQLADGTILEFPDGTDEAVIDRTVKAEMGLQPDMAQPSNDDFTGEFSPAAELADAFMGRGRELLIDPVRRGFNRAERSLEYATGDAEGFAEQSRDLADLGESRRLSDLYAATEGKGWIDTGLEFAKNPSTVLELTLESLAQSIPSLLGGAVVGGTYGLTGGPIGAGIGLAAGTGAGSLFTEYTNIMSESIAEAGYDPTDAAQVADAFGNEAILAPARERALKRGIPIAAFDALSAGMAGRFLKPAMDAGEGIGAAAAKELAMQASAGGAGEAAGSYAAGEEINPTDVLAEAFGELVPGAAETAIAIGTSEGVRALGGNVPEDRWASAREIFDQKVGPLADVFGRGGVPAERTEPSMGALLTPDEIGIAPAVEDQDDQEDNAASANEGSAPTKQTPPPARGVALTSQQAPTEVVTARGTRVPVEWEVIEAADLITSDNEAYDPALQPRQRGDRAASEAQITEIAANLDPGRLGFSAEADRGAPIIGPDNMVESGNGRVAAITRALVADDERGESYRAMIEELTGLEWSDFNEPVLVRRRVGDMTADQRRQFAIEANESSTMEMSDSERANADATMLDARALSLLQPGELTSAANTDFVKSFLSTVTSQGDVNSFIDPNGNLSQSGLRRIQAAIMAKAYGGEEASNNVLARVTESVDDNVRSITGALLDVAGQWAGYRERLGGSKVWDITPNMVEAVEIVSSLRERGQNVQEFLEQQDMLNPRSAVTDWLIRSFYNNDMTRHVGRDKIATVLRYFLEEAEKQDGGLSFGGDVDPVVPEDLLREGKRRANPDDKPASQAGLFGANGKPTQGADNGQNNQQGGSAGAPSTTASTGEGRDGDGGSNTSSTGEGSGAGAGTRGAGGAPGQGSETGSEGRAEAEADPVEGGSDDKGQSVSANNEGESGQTGDRGGQAPEGSPRSEEDGSELEAAQAALRRDVESDEAIRHLHYQRENILEAIEAAESVGDIAAVREEYERLSKREQSRDEKGAINDGRKLDPDNKFTPYPVNKDNQPKNQYLDGNRLRVREKLPREEVVKWERSILIIEELFKDNKITINKLAKKYAPTETLTPEEAQKQIGEWKQHAADQKRAGRAMDGKSNYERVVVSLFDYSGVWAQPYLDAGYEVITIDIQDGVDINDLSPEFMFDHLHHLDNVHAVLAAPPCTCLSQASSKNQGWKKADEDGRTEAAKDMVFATLDFIAWAKPVLWAIENPSNSRIGTTITGKKENNVTGLPRPMLNFQHETYGNPGKKPTSIWGNFNPNLPTANIPVDGPSMTNKVGGKSKNTMNVRSETPEGFAYAFFMANNFIDNQEGGWALTQLQHLYPGASGAIEQAYNAGVPTEQIYKLGQELHDWQDDNAELVNALYEASEDTKDTGLSSNIDLFKNDLAEFEWDEAVIETLNEIADMFPARVAELYEAARTNNPLGYGKLMREMEETATPEDLANWLEVIYPEGEPTAEFIAELVMDYIEDMPDLDWGDRPRILTEDLGDNRIPKGGLTPSFTKVSFTNRRSTYNQAFAAAGFDPAKAASFPIKRQIRILSDLFEETFGVRVVTKKGAKYRETVDSLLDGYRNIQMMLHALGLPAKSLSHDGTLSLVMERFKGEYLGAYSPMERAIYMPGRSNSFAHEWLHSFDHFLFDKLFQDENRFYMATEAVRHKGIDYTPASVEEAFVNVMNEVFFDKELMDAAIADLTKKLYGEPSKDIELNKPGEKDTEAGRKAKMTLNTIRRGNSKLLKTRSDYYQRVKAFTMILAGGNKSAAQKLASYWANPPEMLARAFEAYIATKVMGLGGTTEFITKDEWAYLNESEDRMKLSFPKGENRARIFEAFDLLFAMLSDEALRDPNVEIAQLPSDEYISEPYRWDTIGRTKRSNNSGSIFNRQFWKTWGGNINNVVNPPKQTEGDERPYDGVDVLKSLASVSLVSIGEHIRMIGRKYNSPAIMSIARDLHTAVGSGELSMLTYEEQARRHHNIQMNHVTDGLDINNMQDRDDAQNARIIAAMRGVEAVPDLSREEGAVALLLRRVYDAEWYLADKAGYELGYTPNGFVQRSLDYDKIWRNPERARPKMELTYEDDFKIRVGTPGEEDFDLDLLLLLARNNKHNRFRLPMATQDKVKRLRKLKKKLEAETDETVAEELQAQIDELAASLYPEIQQYYAKNAADRWLTKILVGSPTDFDTKGPDASFTKSRTLPPSADKHLKEFLIKDPVEAVSQYVMRNSRRVAYAQRFGVDGSKMEKRLELAATRDKVAAEHIRQVRSLVEMATGHQSPTGLTQTVEAPLAIAHGLGTLALLETATFTSIAEPIVAFSRTKDFRDIALPFARMMQDFMYQAGWKDSPTAQAREAVALAAGVVVDAKYDMLVAQRMAGDIPMNRRMNRVIVDFFERTLLSPLTRAQRRAMVGTAHKLLGVLLAEATKEVTADTTAREKTAIKIARAELRDLGISDEPAGPDQTLAQPGSIPLVDFAEWFLRENRYPTVREIESSSAGELYSIAIQRIVTQIIQDPKKVNRPYLAGAPILRMHYGIMGFQLEYFSNVMLRLKRTTARNAEISALVAEEEAAAAGASESETKRSRRRAKMHSYAESAGYISAAYASLFAGQFMVTIVREALMNPEKWEELDDEDELMDWLLARAFFRTGITGPLDPYINAVVGIRYERDLANIFIGPQLGYILSNLQVILNALTGRNSENTDTTERNAVKAAYRITAQPALMAAVALMPGSVMTPLLSPVLALGVGSDILPELLANTAYPEKDGSPDGRSRARRDSRQRERDRR